MTKIERLGLDFGRVILGPVLNGKADTSFLGTTFEAAIRTPASEGAKNAVSRLVEAFEHRVWIISKCGESVQRKTEGWLRHSRFHAVTGLPPNNVRFCRERHEKAPICAELGITHFVDDRLDVLAPMVGIVPNLYLFGEQSETAFPEWVTVVPNWSVTIEEILGRVSNRSAPCTVAHHSEKPMYSGGTKSTNQTPLAEQ